NDPHHQYLDHYGLDRISVNLRSRGHCPSKRTPSAAVPSDRRYLQWFERFHRCCLLISTVRRVQRLHRSLSAGGRADYHLRSRGPSSAPASAQKTIGAPYHSAMNGIEPPG